MGFNRWSKRPTILYQFPDFIDYIMFVDENGTSDLKGVRKKIQSGTQIPIGEQFFTVTGVIIHRPDFPQIRKNFTQLKNSYWENGLFFYPKAQRQKRVCFKSNDIRNRSGPFDPTIINYNLFIHDLSNLVIQSPYKIMSANLDKAMHICKYRSNACNPYELCLTFIIERFAKFSLVPQKAKGVLVLESRGKKEDRKLLEYLKLFLSTGISPSGKWVTPDELSFIRGIFFNPKWCSEEHDLKSFIGLELADLVSYPIHKYFRSGEKDRSFLGIENKFDSYPKYLGRGLKQFP